MTKFRKRSAGIVAPAIALLLAATGCAGAAGATDTILYAPPATETPVVEPVTDDADDVIEDADDEKEIDYQEVLEDDTYPARWPLTGIGSQEDLPERPAILVKIDNSSLARPFQEGLEFADIVYEQVVEGGVTRYVAVFHSELPGRIAPVRSARPHDIDIVTPYRGLFVFSGAQRHFIEHIVQAGNQTFIWDSGAPGFTRVGTIPRVGAAALAADPLVMLANANESRAVVPETGMLFARDASQATALTEGSPATSLSVRMSPGFTANYRWDPATDQFLRSDGATASTTVSGARLSATNVIMLAVDSQPSWYDANVPQQILVGSGRAVIATGGHYIEGTWYKGTIDHPFRFYDLAGDPILLAPGNTWIQLVNNVGGGWTIS
ncbi:MAG: DUF3048 domain-containing protein [Promicromonosporaceae bacterium]|nr:DUF3048 domain-containing protein [Promicromonosporaceae bacterium]